MPRSGHPPLFAGRVQLPVRAPGHLTCPAGILPACATAMGRPLGQVLWRPKLVALRGASDCRSMIPRTSEHRYRGDRIVIIGLSASPSKLIGCSNASSFPGAARGRPAEKRRRPAREQRKRHRRPANGAGRCATAERANGNKRHSACSSPIRNGAGPVGAGCPVTAAGRAFLPFSTNIRRSVPVFRRNARCRARLLQPGNGLLGRDEIADCVRVSVTRKPFRRSWRGIRCVRSARPRPRRGMP